MIQIITAENRSLFHHALVEMHRQRKRLFIDGMGWRLQEAAGLEIDQFDSAEAVYLLDMDEAGTVVQSARLLATHRPHLMGEVFPHLCADAPPCSPLIWEASRFCPSPEAPSKTRRHGLGRMIAGIMETALLFGIEQVSFVASAALAPLAIGAGWSVRPLGEAQKCGDDIVSAMLADVTSVGLANVRRSLGVTGPMTRFADAAPRRAA